jgi:hypothetical protein
LFSLFGDGFGRDVAAVAIGVDAGDGFLVELGEENVGDGAMDGLGCRLEEIRKTDVEAAFTETDGGVERGETAEADVESGNGRSGTEFAVLLLEDGDEGGRCGRFFGAWLSGSGGLEGRCRRFLKESGGWSGLRGKELQELTQRRGAGMLRGGQGLVLVAALMCLLEQTSSGLFPFLF